MYKLELKITNIPEISAIYYALLQFGYEYYPIERENEHIDVIRRFVLPHCVPNFFKNTKQTTCDVYSYWPRAAILETATFTCCQIIQDIMTLNVFKIKS